MDKLKMQSENLVDANVEKIASLFPNCVTESMEDGKLAKKVDFDLLRQELSSVLVEGRDERYRLDWAGKRQAILTANSPIAKTLRPCREESVNFDTTENLYIEGDNLDVLKLLHETYLNKVKMIYIDPPYNTGNDFIYNDNFAVDSEEYLAMSNQTDEQGNRMTTNKETSGRYHSDWLSMMYMRLKLAKDLLTDDGVIFISIDDNEQANLKKLCDEIFGEDNFIGFYIKQSKVGGGSDTKYIVKEHEYCAVYLKNYFYANEMFISHDSEYLKRYKEEDKDGKYFWDTFARPGLKNPIVYEITAPDGTKLKNGWIWSEKRFKEALNNGNVRIIKTNGSSWSVQFKQYLNLNGKKPRSMTMDFGGSIDGKKDIVELLNNDKIFSYPKSVKYIKTLIETLNDRNCIVLDFFSGSTTTAHAVMQLNSEDGGNRKFIMVQLPELTDEKSEAYKAGYKNICEIGKERIRRAGEKVATDAWFAQNGVAIKGVEKTYVRNANIKTPKTLEEMLNNLNLDIGFRVLKLADSNMKDVYYNPKEYNQSMLLGLDSAIKEDRTAEDILFQVMLDKGVSLSSKIKKKTTANGEQFYYIVGETGFGIIDLICCLDKKVNTDAVKEIAKLQPECCVFLDSGIENDATRTNIQQIFDTYSPKTKVEVV